MLTKITFLAIIIILMIQISVEINLTLLSAFLSFLIYANPTTPQKIIAMNQPKVITQVTQK